MENKNRLIISVILLVCLFSLSRASPLGIIAWILFLVFGIWAIVEGIIFVSRKENRDALPLALIAVLMALTAMLYGSFGIIMSIVNFGVEGGPFQTISFLWFFIAAVLLFVFGVWTLIKGIVLIRRKKNIKLGIVSLIIGAVIAIPFLVYLIGMIISRMIYQLA